MGFKVIVKEGSTKPWDGNSCTPVGMTPEISDVYPDKHKFRIIEGRLSVFEKGNLIAVYQDWSRVVKTEDAKALPEK